TRHQRLESPSRKQKMRHAIRLVRGFNEKLAHPPHKMALRVVRLRAHQFRRIQLHGTPPTSPPDPSATRKHLPTKNPRTVNSAAGKHLIQMDLPLAACEPSPALRAHRGTQSARRSSLTQDLRHLLPGPPPESTWAGFAFARRTHP